MNEPPITLSRLVKIIGRAAVPMAEMLLPRLTFRNDEPEA